MYISGFTKMLLNRKSNSFELDIPFDAMNQIMVLDSKAA